MPDAFTRYRKQGKRPVRRNASQKNVLIIVVAIGLIVAMGLAVALIYGNAPSVDRRRSGPARRPSADRSAKQAAQMQARSKQRRQREPSWRRGTPVPGGSRTLGDLMQAPDATRAADPAAQDNGSATDPSGKPPAPESEPVPPLQRPDR